MTEEAIIEAVKVLGWSIAIPNKDPEQLVHGFITGTPAYLDYVLSHLD